MELQGKRVVLTGATGGIGKLLAADLVKQGAKVVLLGRNAEKLTKLAQQFDSAEMHTIAGDLTQTADLERIETELTALGGADILINNAGQLYFGEFEQQSTEDLAQLYQTNLIAPVLLSRALLPQLRSKSQGLLVNVGSVFGSLGFAYYTSYCSSKFGLYGFSESLRRELESSNVNVLYVAPRAIRTEMNADPAIKAMHQATKVTLDEPQVVVDAIMNAIKTDKVDVFIGQPESLFTRLNMMFPRLLDKLLKKQTQAMATFAKKAG